MKYKFSEITPEGFSLSKSNDSPVYSFGILPGELVTGEIIRKKKKNFLKPQKIENPHLQRIEPKDETFLSTSPWQIASYQWQIEQKYKILQDLFPDIEINEFLPSTKIWEYRNKVEYSFEEFDGELGLSFYDRLSKNSRINVDNFSLVSKQLNNVAKEILSWCRSQKIPEIALKSLTLRESISEGKIIARLLFRHREKIPVDCSGLKQIKGLSALDLGYSNPKSPASNMDEVFYEFGTLTLNEKIGDQEFLYPIDGFFQNNLELFPKVLSRINEQIQTEVLISKTQKNHKEINSNFVIDRLSSATKLRVLELYCGVGTIGMSLISENLEIVGVDILDKNIEFARKNLKKNNIKNYTPVLSASEKIDEENFLNIDILILDPSRPGLHPKVIKNILKYTPEYIFYMSCNPITQAYDFEKIKQNYNIIFLGGYDFYPQTPHLESLIVLKFKNI